MCMRDENKLLMWIDLDKLLNPFLSLIFYSFLIESSNTSKATGSKTLQVHNSWCREYVGKVYLGKRSTNETWEDEGRREAIAKEHGWGTGYCISDCCSVAFFHFFS